MSGEAPRGEALRAWLRAIPEGERDVAVESLLGIEDGDADAPGEHMIGHHRSGVGAILEALEVVRARDVFVDLGAGAGKVVLLAELLTGARARGIEIQARLVSRAREAAARLGASARFDHADVRDAPLVDGTVFYLYAPFTGPVLSRVIERLRAVAMDHPIVVCALGVELHREARWLVPRPSSSLWLTVYDGAP